MLILFALLGCATERCYDACHTLHGKGEDVCGGPDAPTVGDDLYTPEEKMCRQMCRSSEEAEDRDLDEFREDWVACVSGYERDIAAGSRKYGEPDGDACNEARVCDVYPCEDYIGQSDEWTCLTDAPSES